MAARQTRRTPGKRNEKNTGERATQTWRQPPPTPRQKIVQRSLPGPVPQGQVALRKKSDLARVSRTRRAPTPWQARLGPLGWLRRINWPQVLAFILLAAVTGGLAWGVTQQPFRISADSIAVVGTHRLEPWEVARAANVEGANAFTVLPSEVAKRVSSLEGVNEVTVRVRLPNRLIVQIKEFMPLVAWQTPEGTRWLSEDGALIPIAGDSPALTLVDPLGEAADESGNLRTKVLEGLTIIQEMRPDLREMYFGKLEGLYFRSPEGWTVYLGEDGRMARKLTILEGMKPTMAEGNSQAKILDLRFEEFPTFR